MISDLWTWITSNQFASGGLLIGSVGFALVYARRVLSILWVLVRRRIVCSIEVRNDSALFLWVLAVLSRDSASRSRRWCASLRKESHDDRLDDWTVDLVPAVGLTPLLWRGARLILYRGRDDSVETITPRETMTISSMSWNKPVLRELLDEALRLGHPDAGRNRIMVYDQWNRSWRVLRDQELRSLDTVFLPDEQKRAVVDDARSFLSARADYERRGVPYHRGYLLHGEPGCGKTSLISAMSRELGLTLCVLRLDGINDVDLVRAVAAVPPRSVMVMEDVDCVSAARDRDASSTTERRVTMSGLLNVVDGILTPPGQIVVMTTNRLEVLDPALRRPGRADVTVHVARPGLDQLRDLYLLWRPGDELDAEEFALDLEGETMAEAQRRLMEMSGRIPVSTDDEPW